MDELERMLFWGDVIGIGSLVAPVLLSLATVVLMWKKRKTEPVSVFERVGMMGAFFTVAVGLVGSYATGELVLSAVVGASDLPWHLFVLGWHRMWYPAGLGVVLGFVPIVLLLIRRKAA